MFNRAKQLVLAGLFLFFTGYTVREFNYDPDPENLQITYEYWDELPFDETSIQDGDLILRKGRGFISDALSRFSTKDIRYSHSGIIHRDEEGKIFVYHSIGGESNFTNKMMMDPLEHFCHPYAVSEWAIYRYDLNNEQVVKFDSILTDYYKQEMEFDLDWDLSTDEKMYCSEMIYKGITLATNDENFIPLSRRLDQPYVALDDLYMNEHCKQIFVYEY